MTPDKSIDNEPSQPLSGYKVYLILARKLKQFDAYPLSPDNLVTQADALKRLGTSSDDNWESFATLHHSRLENDSSLRFMLDLSGAGFNLSIEGVGAYVRTYDEVAETEEVEAEQLLAAIQMLSNGQVFVLRSIRKGKLCAVEVVYRRNPNGKPRTFSIQGTDYPLSLHKDMPSAYDWHVSKNDYDFPFIPTPKNFFLALKTPDGDELKLDREFPGGALTPLTKQMNDSIVADLNTKLTGAKDDADLNKRLAASWEYWAIVLVGMGLTPIFLSGKALLWGVPLAFAVSAVIASSMVTRLLKFKHRLRKAHTDHLYLRVDAIVRLVLGDIFSTYGLYVVVMFLLLSSLFLPMYVTNDGHVLVSFVQLIFSGVLVAAIPFAGLLGAFVLSLRKNVDSFGHSFLLGAASVLSVVVVNFSATYTGEDVATPEPQTSVTLIFYVGYLLFVVIQLARGARKLKQDSQK